MKKKAESNLISSFRQAFGIISVTCYEKNLALDDVVYSDGYMNNTKKNRVTLRFNATLGGETYKLISWIEGPKR